MFHRLIGLIGRLGSTVTVVISLGAAAQANSSPQSRQSEWQPLFDGKTLTNWQPTKFGGQGVTPQRIQAWLDQRQIIDQDITGKQIDTRVEVELSQPLGVAAWRTKSAVRNIRLRRL